MKLLFKKRGNEFIGRFHENFPITVKNPITNCRIIGEVEFYKVTNHKTEQREQLDRAQQTSQNSVAPPEIVSPDKPAGSASQTKTPNLDEKGSDSPSKQQLLIKSIQLLNLGEEAQTPKLLTGQFFGTDFNFLYSEEMQRALAQNCLSTNWASLMNFAQHSGGQIHEDIGQFVNGNLQLDFDQHINEIV